MPVSKLLTLKIAGLALLATVGCAPEPRRDPFTATGETIAMGGGGGGPTNACFACHGLDGAGDGQLTSRLAGLPVGYLQKQLGDYADGRRADPLMTPIARALTAEDRQKVSAFYAQLAPPAAPAGQTATVFPAEVVALYGGGDPRRGLEACAACHGADGAGMGPANPPLAGQPPAYLAMQMRRWREGKRRNDPEGAMLRISQALTPAEIEGLSRYASALSPAEPRPDERRAASP